MRVIESRTKYLAARNILKVAAEIGENNASRHYQSALMHQIGVMSYGRRAQGNSLTKSPRACLIAKDAKSAS